MKSYYGNYLGVVITGGEKDPQGRGRCQVFIPHIMPALYKSWNKEAKDIKFSITGQGLDGALPAEIVDTLKKVLPWAECAAPIIGASPSVKPNIIGVASEALRNVGKSITEAGAAIASAGAKALGIEQTPQGDQAANLALSTSAGQKNYASGLCGTAVGNEVLVKTFGYTDKEVRAASPDGRRDGKNYAAIMENLGWKKVPVSRPEDAPPNSILSYGPTARNQYGHVEYKGVNAKGEARYFFGLGQGGISTPGGGSRVGEDNKKGFNGYAYVPPPEIQARALQRQGFPTESPSALSHPNPGTSMSPDPTTDPTGYEGATQETGSLSTPVKMDLTGSTPTPVVNVIPGSSKNKVDVPFDGRNAVIRYNNPGGAYPSANYEKFGMTGYGVIGGGHKIAQYPSVEAGVAANMYQFRNTHGPVVVGKTLAQAREYWVNGDKNFNTPLSQGDAAIWREKTKKYGLDPNTVITADMLKDQNFLGSWMKATSEAEGFTGGLTNDQISKGLTLLDGQSKYDPPAVATTRTPTPHAGVMGPNTNNQALGMFGYASEGTAVWVFFREGNPLFPVYFAASYGANEWQNMYQYASPGLGAGVGPNGAIPGTERAVINLYGGGISTGVVTEDSGLEPNHTFQIYDKNGSNLLFTKDHTQFNSQYNHVSRVLGDHHDITEANKETRVRGDRSVYVEQDQFITIGNWSDEAMAASDEIQQYINEAMELKSKTA